LNKKKIILGKKAPNRMGPAFITGPVHMLIVGSSHNSDEANYTLRIGRSRVFIFIYQFGTNSELRLKASSGVPFCIYWQLTT
jgi:hypothetical protein